MSYIALATNRFEQMTLFYGTSLGFPSVDSWDRPRGRGVRFDLGGMRLEILDNRRERQPLELPPPGDRVHVVIEVDDIAATRLALAIDTPEPQITSWGAKLFQLRDPDGVPVTFLEWISSEAAPSTRIRGRVTTGQGRAAGFTSLPWVRSQCLDKLQFEPFPGTLNLFVEADDAKAAWKTMRDRDGVPLQPPEAGPDECGARCFPVSIEGIGNVAIVWPQVEGYPRDQIELISDIHLRDALSLSDGDEVVLFNRRP